MRRWRTNAIQNCRVRVQLRVQDHLIFKLMSRMHTTSILDILHIHEKAKEIPFSMALASCPPKIGVVHNHQNNTDF
jgi:hypothetical protein